MESERVRRVWSCTLREEEYEEKRALERLLRRREADYASDARALRRYRELCSLSLEDTARALGRSPSSVAERLRLTALPEDVLDALILSGLSERHARALLRLRDGDEQRRCLGFIREQRLSAGEAEELTASLAGEDAPLGAGSRAILLSSFDRCADALRRWGIPCHVAHREDRDALVLTVTAEKRRHPPKKPEKEENVIKKSFTNE